MEVTKSRHSRLRARPATLKSARPLDGHVAVVAGATRGAGRGIARALGEAGATVYCTGRSVRGNPSPYGRPETIDETAEIIHAAGGTAIPVRVDHTVESEIEALFARVDRDYGRLDVLVNSIAGEDPMMRQWGSFWKTDLKNADAILRQSLVSHIITAKHAARLMIRARRGLIVEVTENDILSAGGNPISQVVKLGLKGLALNMATELKPDYDGRRPDWGKLAIDFSVVPATLVDMFRTGTELQLQWLNTVAEQTRAFLAKLPKPSPTRRRASTLSRQVASRGRAGR